MQRAYLFGQDEISDRPNQTETYHDVWFTDRQCAKANGVWHVFVFRAYAVNGGFDAYRCEYVGRWESVKNSITARRILLFMKKHGLRPVHSRPDFSNLEIRISKYGNP